MIARFWSGVSWLSLNTGMFSGPDSIAVYICLSVDAFSDGAILPADSGAPLNVVPWQDAQLSRNSAPPAAIMPSLPRREPIGMPGPPPTDST